ncbi:hypothetical protein LCGC14_1035580 [marine sediment metagenome]|uniref:Uncharacterized protein n=1 Tax=marine sediment metagenome TaxID=412755 RepID=A0A0F9QZD9_9ZZZZ
MSGSGVAGEVLGPNFDINVALGKIDGISGTTRSGFNGDVGATTEDVWPPSILHVYLTSSETMDITSDNAADTGVGTGAQTLLISGVDDSFISISETVTMNGVAGVTTVNSYLRINDMFVVTAGSGEANAGIITATATVAGTIQSQMIANANSDSVFQFTIPAGLDGFLTNFQISVGSSDQAVFSFFTRTEGGLFIELITQEISNTGFSLQASPYLFVPEKSDFRCVAARTSGAAISISAVAQLYLVEI